MDIQEPKSIQEVLHLVDYQGSGVALQVRLLSLMCAEIDDILKLDAELSDRILNRMKYYVYQEYMDQMADILENLQAVKPLLLRAFPGFCTSRLYKVINIHLKRRKWGN